MGDRRRQQQRNEPDEPTGAFVAAEAEFELIDAARIAGVLHTKPTERV